MPEAADEGLGLGRNRDMTVATAPHGACPCLHQSVGLASEIAVDEFHEVGQLIDVVRGQVEVVVVSECHGGVDPYRVLLLGSGEDADHHAGKVRGRGQEIETTEGPGGDLDASSRGQVAGISRHGCSSQAAPEARLIGEWRPDGWREGPTATRRESILTHRRQPVSVSERHRRVPCGLTPATPKARRKKESING